MNQAQSVIAIDHLTKRYGDFEAVSDLTLHVGEGSICGLLGPNGAGKTTAMKCLLGFLHPTAGSLMVGGSPVSPETFEHLSYVPETSALFDELTVQQHLELDRRSQPRHDSARAAQLINTFQLDMRKRVRSLSKGQKTAFALVLALASRPRILVLDEPSSGLDPIFQRVVLDLLIECATDGGSVLFSSHQIGQVERAADHVAILRNGKLVLHRDVESLKASEKVVEATFEHAIPDINGTFNMPAIRRIDRAGNMLRLSVKDQEEEVAQQLERFHPTSLRVVNRNLEDIFLDVVSENQP